MKTLKYKNRTPQAKNFRVSPRSFVSEGGQAIMITVVFFVFISLAVVFGSVGPLLKDVKIAKNTVNSTKSFFTAESGNEDIFYRLKNGMQVSGVENISLNNASTTIIISDISGFEKEILSMSSVSGSERKVKSILTIASGTSFNYGVQAGAGGMKLKNTSSIIGNVYSNGVVQGDNNNLITGDVISVGGAGNISQIQSTGNAYANVINNSTIGNNAYYQTISGSTVGGTSYPGSANMPAINMPITDALINQWEADAAAGGVINTCPYNITTDITLGPVKINCDLKIVGNTTVTLTGNVWVVGSIKVDNTGTVKVAPSLGATSVAMIADNPADRVNSSVIKFEINSQVSGSGQAGSYVLLVSQNNAAETAQPGEEAIQVEKSVSGDLILYAPHGEIRAEDNVNLKGIAGYIIDMKNSSTVNYEIGLVSLLFSSGPGGSWNIKDWKEVK